MADKGFRVRLLGLNSVFTKYCVTWSELLRLCKRHVSQLQNGARSEDG